MKRNYIPFITGMFTMLLVGMVGFSVAKEQDAAPPCYTGELNGKVAYGQAGVALFSERKVEPGEALTTEKGAKVPSVLTYTDENGEKTYYIAAQTVAKITDMSDAPTWNEALNSVDFCGRNKPNVVEVDLGEEAPKDLPSGSIVISHGTSEDLEALRQKEQMEIPVKPEYGVQVGPYTEVDPAELDWSRSSGYGFDRAYYESNMGVEQAIGYTPENGNYIALTIENVGKSDAIMLIDRPCTIGDRYDRFSSVRIPAGQTLVRAFYLADDAEDLQEDLRIMVDSVDKNDVCIYFSDDQLEQTAPKK